MKLQKEVAAIFTQDLEGGLVMWETSQRKSNT